MTIAKLSKFLRDVLFCEGINRTIGDKLKKPVFEQVSAIWIYELHSIVKIYNYAVHHSTLLKYFNVLRN